MAVLIRQEIPGMAVEQFMAVMAALVDDLQLHPGFIASASGPIPGGYQVTEVWESRESQERWARELFAPELRRVGLERALPPSEYLPLDQVITR